MWQGENNIFAGYLASLSLACPMPLLFKYLVILYKGHPGFANGPFQHVPTKLHFCLSLSKSLHYPNLLSSKCSLATLHSFFYLLFLIALLLKHFQFSNLSHYWLIFHPSQNWKLFKKRNLSVNWSVSPWCSSVFASCILKLCHYVLMCLRLLYLLTGMTPLFLWNDLHYSSQYSLLWSLLCLHHLESFFFFFRLIAKVCWAFNLNHWSTLSYLIFTTTS